MITLKIVKEIMIPENLNMYLQMNLTWLKILILNV